jgi:phage-related protein
MHDFVFDNKSLHSFGFTIKERPEFEIPERDFELVDIAGADGSSISDNLRYKNVERVYTINRNPFWQTEKSNQELINSIIDWLYSFDGSYKILRDTYHKGYFCYAVCQNPTSITSATENLLETTVTFSRKPYWYSDVGQQAINYNSGATSATFELFNSENYFSLPYIKVTTEGAFTLTVNDVEMKASSCSKYLEFDSELQNVFKGSTDKNKVISGDYFPKFKVGKNTITVSSTSDNQITSIQIIPRWRRL